MYGENEILNCLRLRQSVNIKGRPLAFMFHFDFVHTDIGFCNTVLVYSRTL